MRVTSHAPGGDLSRSQLIGRHPPFVDRIEQLWWLERTFSEALRGEPRLVFLDGEAGIGKTRLVREFGWITRRLGGELCIGRAYEGSSVPYLPIAEALRAWRSCDPTRFDLAVAEDPSILRPFLFPGELSEQQGRPVQVSGDRDRMRLFGAISKLATTLSARNPTLIVLEDLHWADSATIDLLSHLVFSLADTGQQAQASLMIVVTHRPLEDAEQTRRSFSRLRREDITANLEIGGFDEALTRHLISHLGIERPSHQLVSTVHEATDGNPLFIQSVIHQLRETGGLVQRGGYTVTDLPVGDLRLPEDVTTAIEQRVLELSEPCKTALTTAAFLGESFTLQALAAVSGIGEDDLLDLLEEAMDARILDAYASGYLFHHGLVRHVVKGRAMGDRAQRIHLSIVEMLERQGPDAATAMEIAHHMIEAGPRAEVTRLVVCARRAGAQAFAIYAWAQAANFYSAAARAAEESPEITPQERAELYYRSGVAYNRDYDPGPCLHAYARAVDTFREAGDEPGLAGAVDYLTRARITLASVPYGTQIDLGPQQEALEALGDSEPRLRGMMLETMSEAYFTAQRPDEAVEMARQALQLGEKSDDPLLRSHAYFGLGLAQLQRLEVREALNSWQDSLANARLADDLWLQQQPRQRIGLAQHLLGDLDGAARTVREPADGQDRTLQHLAEASLSRACAATTEAALGELHAAEESGRESIALVVRSKYPWSGMIALPALACARALRGALTEAEDALDVLRQPGRIFEEVGAPAHLLAAVYCALVDSWAGREIESPAQRIGDFIKLARIAGPDASALGIWCALAEIAIDRDLTELLDEPCEVLADAAERGVVLTTGWVFLIPRVLARCAAARGEDAEEAFGDALEVARRTGAAPELAHTELDYASWLARRGDPESSNRARALAVGALASFQRLEMVRFADQAESLARNLGASCPTAAHSADGPMFDQLETQLLRRLAHGRSEDDIADSLVLRPATLRKHVDTVYRKLNVTGRSAATASAVRIGIAAEQEDGPTPLVILVDDIKDFTGTVNRIGDARGQDFIHIHNRIMRDALLRHRGNEITHTGDGLIAAFRSASDALRCAKQIQESMVEHSQENPDIPIRVRIGVNAGEPLPEEERLFGTAVNLAVRICHQARAGEILISDVVRQLCAGSQFSFGERDAVTLKGYSEEVVLNVLNWKPTTTRRG